MNVEMQDQQSGERSERWSHRIVIDKQKEYIGSQKRYGQILVFVFIVVWYFPKQLVPCSHQKCHLPLFESLSFGRQVGSKSGTRTTRAVAWSCAGSWDLIQLSHKSHWLLIGRACDQMHLRICMNLYSHIYIYAQAPHHDLPGSHYTPLLWRNLCIVWTSFTKTVYENEVLLYKKTSSIVRRKFYYRNSIIKRSIMRRKFQCRKHISIRRRKLYGKAVLLWKRNSFLTRKLQYGKGVSFLWRKFYYGFFIMRRKFFRKKGSIMRRKFYYGTSFIMRRKFNNGKTFPLRKGRSIMEK